MIDTDKYESHCVSCGNTISHSVDESVCYVCKDIYCESCANWEFTMREEDAEVVCPRCQTDLGGEEE